MEHDLLSDAITTTYVSRVVAVPVDLAPRTFEAWWRDRRRESRMDPVDLIDLHGGCLSLDGLSWSRFHVADPLTPFGHVLGRLGARWLRSWPIEIELLPWSSTHSELGMRYTGRRRMRDADRYLRLADRALAALSTDLLQHVAEPESARVTEPMWTPDAA